MKSVGLISHPPTRRAVPEILAWSMAIVFLAMNFTPVQAQSNTPNFTGVWGRDAHNYPKPYMAPGRGGGVKDGFNNEYLKPWVVELLMRDDLVTRSGRAVVTSHSVCYPEGVPYVFGGSVLQILQTPSEITMLFGDTSQFRTIYMNRPHSEHVVPSWYGESVGHFEGDTLVVDTVGIAVNPEAGSMGNYGTPHTEALHLVERYRYLMNGEKSLAPRPHDDTFDSKDIIAGGKTMRLNFTVEDPGAYKKPWSVTLDFLPINERVREYVCAENSREADLTPLIPAADIPDF